MNNNNIIMTRIVTLEYGGNLDSSRSGETINVAISQYKYRQGDSHKLVSEFTISFEQLHL